MQRRTFLARLGQTLVALPVMTIPLGCGKNDPAAPAAGGESFLSESSLSSGHTHSVTLTCTDMKGGTLSFSSTNSSGHTHVLSLSFDQVTRILNGESVGPITSSSNSGHTHNWTLQKPANICT